MQNFIFIVQIIKLHVVLSLGYCKRWIHIKEVEHTVIFNNEPIKFQKHTIFRLNPEESHHRRMRKHFTKLFQL